MINSHIINFRSIKLLQQFRKVIGKLQMQHYRQRNHRKQLFFRFRTQKILYHFLDFISLVLLFRLEVMDHLLCNKQLRID